MRFSILKDYFLEIGTGIDKWHILQRYQDMHNLMNKKNYKWTMYYGKKKNHIHIKLNYMY